MKILIYRKFLYNIKAKLDMIVTEKDYYGAKIYYRGGVQSMTSKEGTEELNDG